jgi:hypothetical protein
MKKQRHQQQDSSSSGGYSSADSSSRSQSQSQTSQTTNTNTNTNTTSSALGWAYINHYKYVQNEKIKSLRSKIYNPKKAVKAMSIYYTKKKLYFGIHNLCIDITMSCLTDIDIFYLKQGGMQMLEGCGDCSGRIITIQFGKIWEYMCTN